jgi:cell division protein FtsB
LEQLQQQPVVQMSDFNEQSARIQQLEAENMNLKSDLQYVQD